MKTELAHAYRQAQHAIGDLKGAVRVVLQFAPPEGLSNAQIGRTLGIYAGHEGHEGHISRTLLQLLKSEGVVIQDSETKRWRLREQFGAIPDGDDS